MHTLFSLCDLFHIGKDHWEEARARMQHVDNTVMEILDG